MLTSVSTPCYMNDIYASLYSTMTLARFAPLETVINTVQLNSKIYIFTMTVSPHYLVKVNDIKQQIFCLKLYHRWVRYSPKILFGLLIAQERVLAAAYGSQISTFECTLHKHLHRCAFRE